MAKKKRAVRRRRKTPPASVGLGPVDTKTVDDSALSGLAREVEADGGIRRNTVPLLAAAGADYIVPGSLMFKEDPAEMRRWLATLG